MNKNNLIESTAKYLDNLSTMIIVEERETYNTTEEERPSNMKRTLHDFLFHLSSPSDPTGKQKLLKEELDEESDITEATVFDISKGDKPGKIRTGLPKTDAIIAKGEEEGLGVNENLHKKIGAGFKSAFDSMKTEHPKESMAKLRESKQIFKDFARSRGFKGNDMSMLRGNMKTQKSTGENVLTTGLNLAPHTAAGLHGFDVCPKASHECRQNCLGTTAGGNKQYPDTALSSKALRTHFLVKHPEHAARIIDSEITSHEKSAKKKGMLPGIRMNITSDISWEHHAPDLFKRHPNTQFYDYTKLANRVKRSLTPGSGHPENYHLSLSHTGTGHAESNDKDVADVLHKGGVSAMVFQRGKDNKLPTHVEDVSRGVRYPVVNGDDDDNTFDRHGTLGKKQGKIGGGVVSGLQLKGVKNEDAGHFANKVDPDGIMRINKPVSK